MLVTWPRWLPCQYMVKTLQNILLRNRMTDFHETWYVASWTAAHHSLFNWWPLLDLDLLYGKVKFYYLCFSIGKSENSGFFRNYCSLWPESWDMQTTNWVYDGMWVFKVKVISWPWPKVMSRKPLRHFNQIVYVSFWVHGNENSLTWCLSQDKDGHHANIW